MSSFLFAKGNAKSVNNEDYEVRIIRTTSGTDSDREFSVGASGVNIIYESTDDTLLVPGIVHSRCEVETCWSSGDVALTQLITNLLAAQDGDYLLEVLRETERIWVGTILVEQVDLLESSSTQKLRIVATDGISLLRNVDYNNNGTAYTGSHIILDDILNNIQQKWLLYAYLDEQNTSANRIEIADDVYSTDDLVMSLTSHPGGTALSNTRRMRIHTSSFKRFDDTGQEVFSNCYELLESICLTLQLRMYYYGNAWSFVPVSLSDEVVNGYALTYQDQHSTTQVVSSYDYQVDTTNNIRQKGAEWVHSYTPQLNEVKLTRDTRDRSRLMFETYAPNGSQFTISDFPFEGINTAPEDLYICRIRFRVINTPLSLSGQDRLGRLILALRIKYDPTGSGHFYHNTLTPDPAGPEMSLNLLNYLNIEYTEIVTHSPTYSDGTFFPLHKKPDPRSASNYDTNTAGNRVVTFDFPFAPPQTAKTGLELLPTLRAYDVTGTQSSTLEAALDIEIISLQLNKYSGDRLQNLEDFDYVAKSTTGRGEINMGTTQVGALGETAGAIVVETATGVFEPTNNWVNQASATQRAINKLAVTEVLAAHTESRNVQRGSIVLRGSSATPGKPFSRYKDRDTGDFFSALNWSLHTTQAEMELTLRKIGRNATSVTTEEQSGTRLPDPPFGDTSQTEVQPVQVMRGYNNEAQTNFQGDWTTIIGGSETKEMYLSVSNLGQGRFYDAQGDTPAAGTNIVRKVYVNTSGLGLRDAAGWTSPSTLQPAVNGTLQDVFDKISNYVNQLDDHGAYTFLSTYAEVAQDKLLDEYTGATAAYALRKLRNDYTGDSITVRRTSGSGTQDIGFDADGNLDTTALSAFCGSGDGFITKWHDQVGVNDVFALATSAQPKIYDSGAVITLNGKPAIQLDGSDDSLVTASSVNLNANRNELIVAWVGSVTNLDSGNNMVSHWNNSAATQIFQVQMTASNDNLRWTTRYSNGTLATANSGSAITSGNQSIIVGRSVNGTHEAEFDGTTINGTSVAVDPNDSSLSLLRIGARADNQAGPHQGKTQEVIIWSRATELDDADDISDDINTYYSTY